MKKFILAITLVMTSTVALAEQQEKSVCDSIQEVAYTIMKVRQSGVSMAKMYNAANGTEFIEKMVIAAYDIPAFTTESIKQSTIQDFADKMFLQCVKAQQ